MADHWFTAKPSDISSATPAPEPPLVSLFFSQSHFLRVTFEDLDYFLHAFGHFFVHSTLKFRFYFAF